MTDMGQSYAQANSARDQANTARGNANDAYSQANTAYSQANSARGQANTAYGQANSARSDANTTFATINTTFGTVNTNYQAAYAQANNARDQANTARTQANTGYDQANTARTQANTAYGQANSAYGQANAAYGAANTKLASAGGTVSGDLIITGNLTVSGNQTILNTEVLTTEDAEIILLSNTAGTPALNAGLIVNRGTSTNTFLRWNEAVDEWGWSDSGTTTYYFEDLRSGLVTTNTTFGTVNTTFGTTNTTFGTVNTTFATLNTSAGTQNTAITNAHDQANSARGQANTAYGQANLAYAQANSARDQANTAYGQANSAYGAANNRVLKAGDTMTGNLTISGATLNTATANISTIITGNALTISTGTASNGNIIFSSNGTEDMRITAPGNVGIGTNSPLNPLHVAGGYNQYGQLYIQNTIGAASNANVVASVNTTGDLLTLTAATGWANGQALIIKSTVSVPGGLNSTFMYYGCMRSTTTLTLHTTVANAQAGTSNVDITSAGSGTITLMPVAELATMASSISNSSYLKFYKYRHTPGADWQTAATRIQQVIDSTHQGFIEFNPPNGTYGIAFGQGSQYFMQINSSGNVGIGTTTPSNPLHVIGDTFVSANIRSTAFHAGGRNSPYTSISETSSGAMSVFAHNASGSTGSSNVIKAQNTGYHSHFIRMYYDQGIAFHTSSGTRTAGDILYDFVTPANVVSGTAERMRIDISGNVGIGTTSPANLLDVWGPDGSGGRIRLVTKTSGSNSFQQIFFVGNTGSTVNDGYLQLHDNGTAKISMAANASRGGDTYFNTGGNFGIGTTNPSSSLHVYGNTQIYSGSTGNSPPLIFGSETGLSKKAIFLENYWMVYQGHDNEGHKFRSVNAGGSSTDDMTITGAGLVLINTSTSSGYGSGHRITRSVSEGGYVISIDGGVEYGALFQAVSGAGYSSAAAAQWIGKNSSTNRSINAGGTVNASGADYAEYMEKAGEFIIAKGDICGINSNGKLTNVYSDAIAFVVKSTNPSYVGGDGWGAGFKDDPEGLEAARQKVDRVAFSGQVPVNVIGATPGQYIIPVNDNDVIRGIAVTNPTFEQYQISVGKVVAIEEDGRARIIVKVA
jgi:hypothetical protein